MTCSKSDHGSGRLGGGGSSIGCRSPIFGRGSRIPRLSSILSCAAVDKGRTAALGIEADGAGLKGDTLLFARAICVGIAHITGGLKTSGEREGEKKTDGLFHRLSHQVMPPLAREVSPTPSPRLA